MARTETPERDVAIQAILDRVEIRELTALYNRAFDDSDADAFADTFTPDGVFEVGGEVVGRGRAALVAYVRSRPTGTVHVTTDAIVTLLDRDVAIQCCTLLVARLTGDGAAVALQVAGRYVDRLVRTDAGWRFAHRATTIASATP
jgi:uncharacterized protein (TIGR02246 family)